MHECLSRVSRLAPLRYDLCHILAINGIRILSIFAASRTFVPFSVGRWVRACACGGEESAGRMYYTISDTVVCGTRGTRLGKADSNERRHR